MQSMEAIERSRAGFVRTFFTHSSAGLRPARSDCGASGPRSAPVRALLVESTHEAEELNSETRLATRASGLAV